MKEVGTGAERTKGSDIDVEKAVENAGYDKKKLNCAKCKLETSFKNRRAEQKRKIHTKGTKIYIDHADRIKLDTKRGQAFLK